MHTPQQIPVNCPFATKVANYQRDGVGRVDGNQGGAPNYFPNSFGGPEPLPSATWHADKPSGDVARVETADADNFAQCGNFFRSVLGPAERERLTDNIAGSLVEAQEFLQKRAVANLSAVDANYGRMVQAKVQKLKAQKKAASAAKPAAPLNPPRQISKY